ncbi:restriction endonuclease subunit S [Aquipseudomonas alcaligenes]|uniref:restriction endonuclease subunit S n=1 Tax=Aquipseudomonas alcaligenes TaxID=43263 RepID=UPI0024329C78|nr:restriction endonuclease subunit S [Pseudomonas alcaligenes]
MVPKGWHRTTVGDLCDLINGNGFKPSDWAEEGLPIIRIQNLNGSADFNHFAGTPNPRWIVSPGDILFAWAGSKGISFGAKRWLGPKGVLNQHIFRVEAKTAVDAGWLYEALRTVTERVESQAHGFKATLLHVQKADITEQQLLVPPISEQKKIACILSTWDQAISVTEKILTNSLQHKKTLEAALLSGKKRVPGFGSWQKTRIGAFIEESRVVGSAGNIAKKLTVRLYGQGVIAKDEKRQGSESTKYYRRSAGQFIYSKLDFLNGAFGIIPDELDGYESTLDLPAFNFKNEVDATWFLKFVSRASFYSANLGLANGGRKARRVNPKDLLELEIDAPCYEEQRAISRILVTADSEIKALKNQLDFLKQEKKALMQQLLTGKRRVTVDEPEVA